MTGKRRVVVHPVGQSESGRGVLEPRQQAINVIRSALAGQQLPYCRPYLVVRLLRRGR